MKRLYREFLISVLLVLALGSILLLGTSDTEMSAGIWRVILGVIVVLFLPGYRVTGLILNGEDEVDPGEYLALSFSCSISLVPLMVFYSNLLGIPIGHWLVLSVCGSIILLSFLYRLRG